MKVRKKDLSRVLALLEKEGLIPAAESRDIDQWEAAAMSG